MAAGAEPTPEVGLALVIGDVAGHDRNAAAVMAQIRNVLRGVAQTVLAPPGRVLTALDTTLEHLQVRSLATAVLAQVRQDATQATAGRCTVWWSNAGHPPPLLLLPGGTVPLLERRPDLLLGSPRAPPGPTTGSCCPQAPPCCSTPTAWSNGAARTSTWPCSRCPSGRSRHRRRAAGRPGALRVPRRPRPAAPP
jgi:hypothetical protein